MGTPRYHFCSWRGFGSWGGIPPLSYQLSLWLLLRLLLWLGTISVHGEPWVAFLFMGRLRLLGWDPILKLPAIAMVIPMARYNFCSWEALCSVSVHGEAAAPGRDPTFELPAIPVAIPMARSHSLGSHL